MSEEVKRVLPHATPVWGAHLQNMRNHDMTRKQVKLVLELCDRYNVFGSQRLSNKVWEQFRAISWTSCTAQGWCGGLGHRVDADCNEECFSDAAGDAGDTALNLYIGEHGDCDHYKTDAGITEEAW